MLRNKEAQKCAEDLDKLKKEWNQKYTDEIARLEEIVSDGGGLTLTELDEVEKKHEKELVDIENQLKMDHMKEMAKMTRENNAESEKLQ